MPRDSNGVYTLPGAYNPVAGNTVIEAAWANVTLDDVALAMTNSLDRNGTGGMLSPLGFANGSEAAPGITYTNEPTTGWYLAGAGDMRATLQGQDTFRVYQGNAQVWVTDTWQTLLYSAGGGALIPGTTAWQSLTWNNATGDWVPTSAMTINGATNDVGIAGDLSVVGTVSSAQFIEAGTALASKYLNINGTADDSDLLNGQTGAYYLSYTNMNGTVPSGDLSGTYSISITGTATNCSRSVLSGTGLTGGGVLNSNQTLSLDTGSTRNTDHNNVSITGGTGLTGGGTITGNQQINLDTGFTDARYLLKLEQANSAVLADEATAVTNQAGTPTPLEFFVGGSGAGTDANTLYFRTS